MIRTKSSADCSDSTVFSHTGLPAVSHKKTVFFFHIKILILSQTKLVRLRWLDIADLILFLCVYRPGLCLDP